MPLAMRLLLLLALLGVVRVQLVAHALQRAPWRCCARAVVACVACGGGDRV
jgi:hypothetical protein